MHFGIRDLIDVLLVAFFLELGHTGHLWWCGLVYCGLDPDLPGVGDAFDGRDPG